MVGTPGEAVDPGWRPSLLWAVLPPNIAMWRANKNAAGVPFIVVHRGVFVSFLSSTFIFLVVLLFVLPINEYGSPNALVYTMLIGGAISVLTAMRFDSRLTRAVIPGSTDSMIGHYQTVFFLEVALTQAGAMAGFIAAFMTQAIWPYCVALAFATAGMLRIAPTTRRLDQLDLAVRHAGYAGSLKSDIMSTLTRS